MYSNVRSTARHAVKSMCKSKNFLGPFNIFRLEVSKLVHKFCFWCAMLLVDFVCFSVDLEVFQIFLVSFRFFCPMDLWQWPIIPMMRYLQVFSTVIQKPTLVTGRKNWGWSFWNWIIFANSRHQNRWKAWSKQPLNRSCFFF